MKPYLLALDQGTTSSRCILFDRHGTVLSRVNREFRQSYPQDGWVEQDATEILASQMGVAVEAMLRAGIGAEEIAAIGITNQRETVIVWDRATGKPICPAIVWQCRRTAERCAELKRQGLESMLHAKTGLIADPYFSATKLQWILENIPDARRRAEAGELCFGTVDSWLIWNLTGGKVHATDPSNAARTMLYNIRTLDWDDTLLKALDIPRCILPRVADSSEVYGTTDLCGVQVPVAGIAGDQQADDHQCQQNTGKCRQHIAKAHQHIVHDAAEIAGNGAQHRAAHRAHGHSTQRDPVGGPGALQHPAENIPAKAVRSHQVSQRRPRQLRTRCHGVGVIGRPEKAENDQSRQDAGHHQSHGQVRISLFHLPIPPIRGSMQRLTRSARVPESTTQKARITTMASTTG